MAIRQSTQSGNTNSVPFAFGSAVNNGDQLQVTNAAHAINFDADIFIGISLSSCQQTPIFGTAVGSGGSLPAGNYAVKIAAFSGAGITTPSVSSFSVVISASQKLRVPLPALPPGASSWCVYLTQAGGAEWRRYATGQPAGNFDCSSANWEDGSLPFASAPLPVFGDAFGYSTPTSHSGGISIADGVKVTCKGDFSFLGNFTRGVGSILEFDASSSPSGAAVYGLFFGTVNAPGTPKLISRGSSSARARVRGKSGTTAPFIGPATQFTGFSDCRLDLQWDQFSKLGDASHYALYVYMLSVYTHLLSDVIFDSDCYTVNFVGATPDGGWSLDHVSFRQTAGQTISGRSCNVAFQPGNNKTTGVRLVNRCSFSFLPVGFGRGGCEYRNCFLYDGWALVSEGPGGPADSDYFLNSSFLRLNMPGAGTGIDTQSHEGQGDDVFGYIDNISGPTTIDFNPHGVGASGKGVGTTRIQNNWVWEYNMDSGEGDMFKGPGGFGTVRLTNILILPNRANAPSGTLMTSPDGGPSGYFLEIDHCTAVGEQYCVSLSENFHNGGKIAKLRNCLVYSIVGTDTFRFIVSNIHDTPTEDVLDTLVPSGCDYNAGWNLRNASAPGQTFYNTNLSAPVGAHDVDLGDSAGADVALFGPKFVDPTRRFQKWAETVLGATGTPAQKITKGLDALRAIADTTSADYVPGLFMTDPAAWCRAGFEPTASALIGTAEFGTTFGAVQPLGGGGVGNRVMVLEAV
jgi:hypothetical protein